MSVTVFSTGPTCVRCTAVKRHLDRRGVVYTEVDLNGNIEQAIELRRKGFNLAPVVRVEMDGTESFCEGYRPDFLDGLQAALV